LPGHNPGQTPVKQGPDFQALFYTIRMSKLLDKVQAALDAAGLEYKVLECDPALADTAQFCEHYGFSLDQSANAIVVVGKGAEPKFCCCLVLANTRLDVNKTVCKLLGVRKASFASAEQTKDRTGMEIGGVTPFGLPDGMPIYVDAAVMAQKEVVVGGGNRSSKVVLDPQEMRKIPDIQVIDGLAKPKE
jgi:prolyl-tRNA editing enzyme YbaK/EbsC (Cys-tRNA(Pro) deacylase)